MHDVSLYMDAGLVRVHIAKFMLASNADRQNVSGAGVGLPGLILDRVCRRVFLTDFAEDVLRQCRQNVCLNALRQTRVRKIDWNDAKLEIEQTEKAEDPAENFLWKASDLEELNECSTFLAADVIYSNEITEAFASQVREIARPSQVREHSPLLAPA